MSARLIPKSAPFGAGLFATNHPLGLEHATSGNEFLTRTSLSSRSRLWRETDTETGRAEPSRDEPSCLLRGVIIGFGCNVAGFKRRVIDNGVSRGEGDLGCRKSSKSESILGKRTGRRWSVYSGVPVAFQRRGLRVLIPWRPVSISMSRTRGN